MGQGSEGEEVSTVSTETVTVTDAYGRSPVQGQRCVMHMLGACAEVGGTQA